MNKQEADILNVLLQEPFINQRILAEVSGHSLGVVNRSLKELIKEGYLNEDAYLTAKAVQQCRERRRVEQSFLPQDLVCGWYRSIRKCPRVCWK